MIGLKDYIAFSKTHGRESAKFLTQYEGRKIYVGTFLDNKPRIIGYPLLMTEAKNKVIPLSREEIVKVLASLPDDE